MINMASPIQFCIESCTSDWLKAIMIPDEGAAADNTYSSPSKGELMPRLCPLRPSGARGPVVERRLRPPHDQLALKCPRCDSSHTKFCYYNNYSLSQPRYFCKTCRRYWTKGGSLRNVPVGGGCRKSKRPPPSRKPPPPAAAAGQFQSTMHHHHHQTDLHLSNLNFTFDSRPGGGHFASGFGFGLGDDSAGAPLGAYSMPFGRGWEEEPNVVVDVKPGNRMLSLEWPDQGCGDSFGYSNGSLGLWAGMINGHGPSSAAM